MRIPERRLIWLGLIPFWLAAAVFLVLWWRSTAAQARLRDAPACAEAEVFTGTPCRAALAGTVVKLTSDEVELEVGGRRLTMETEINGHLADKDGKPATVTIYRGKPIRVEVAGLAIDAPDAPSRTAMDELSGGLFLLVFPAVALGLRWVFLVMEGFIQHRTARARRGPL